MKRQLHIMVFLIVALCSIYPTTSKAHSVLQLTTFPLYEGEGSFVEAPAEVGATVGFFIGVPPAFILGSPGFIFGQNDYTEYACGITLIVIGQPFSFLFGAPSYILKKLFWDGPIFLWDVVYDEASYNEAGRKFWKAFNSL